MAHKTALGGVHTLNNGTTIPRIGFGTAQVGKLGADCESQIRAALTAGYRNFDTAHTYGNEEQVGLAIEKVLPEVKLARQDIFLQTKVPILNKDTEEVVEKAIKQSLTLLKTDYLDSVLIHYPGDRRNGNINDYETNKKNRKIVWQILEKYYESGLIKSIGVSNYEVYHLVELFEYAKVKPALNQVEYHPYFTRPTLKAFCERHGIFFQAFSSLAASGNKKLIAEPAVTALATKYNTSPQTILYAFPFSIGAGLIPKSNTPSRIATNLTDVAKIHLTKEEIASLLALDKNARFSDCTPWTML